MRFPRGKWIIFAIVYLSWQVAFSIVVSPLVLGVLSAEQMGFTLNTVWMGLIVGAGVLALTTILARTRISYGLYMKGLSHIKTRDEFEQFWSASLRGCDDGLIAETHWSGAILPLFMLGFAALAFLFRSTRFQQCLPVGQLMLVHTCFFLKRRVANGFLAA